MVTIPGRRSVASWVAVAMLAGGVALVSTPAQAAGLTLLGSDAGVHGEYYAVSYDANDGTGAPSTRYASVSSSVALHDGTGVDRAGYTLDAWTTGRDGSGTRFGLGAWMRMPSHSVSLYAHWTVNRYSVSFDANEGIGSEPTVTGDFGAQVSLARGDNLSRDGYSLVDWATAPDGSGTHYGLGDVLQVPSHGVALHAQWRADTYGVRYDANGGVGAEPDQSADYAAALSLSSGSRLDRLGWTLESWNTAADASGTRYALGDGVRMPSHDMRLYAHWTITRHRVLYEPNEGDGSEDERTEDYDAEFPLGHGYGLSRPCYTLDSWNTRADGSGNHYGLDEPIRMPFGGLRLFAHWTENRYAVDYDANDGQGTENEQVASYGSHLDLGDGSGLEREGYTLDGWTEEQDGSGAFYGLGEVVRMPCRGLHLWGHWKINSYALRYDANGGSGSEEPQTRTYASLLPLADGSGMSRTGYTIVGWNTAPDGSGIALELGGSIRVPCHNVVLYAQWVADDHTVTYLGNGATGGTVPDAQTFTVEAPASIAGNSGDLAREGYVFLGWATSGDGEAEYTAGATYGEASDLTLYAAWLAADYAIVYNANGATGGAVPDAQTFSVELPATISGNTGALVRTGYRFLGWSSAPDGAVDHAVGAGYGTPVTLNLYAVWTALPVTIAPATATTRFAVARTVFPLGSIAAPAGQTWSLCSLRVVDPTTHALVTRAVTRSGVWTVKGCTGAVTFAPTSTFVGSARVGFSVSSSGGLVSSSTVTIVVLAARLLVRSATVYFAPMSAALSPAARTTLRALAAAVKRLGHPVSSVTTGYVQAAASSANDRSLSAARARNVAAYLTRLGLPHATSARGLGKAYDKGWRARRATATITFRIS